MCSLWWLADPEEAGRAGTVVSRVVDEKARQVWSQYCALGWVPRHDQLRGGQLPLTLLMGAVHSACSRAGSSLEGPGGEQNLVFPLEDSRDKVVQRSVA